MDAKNHKTTMTEGAGKHLECRSPERTKPTCLNMTGTFGKTSVLDASIDFGGRHIKVPSSS